MTMTEQMTKTAVDQDRDRDRDEARYIALDVTEYYGADNPDKTAALSDPGTLAAARLARDQAIESDDDDFVRLGHNECANYLTVVKVVNDDIDPSDWQSWPQEMLDAACEIARDRDIDPNDVEAVDASDIDWIKEAAWDCGYRLVDDPDFGHGRTVLCSDAE